MIFGPRFVVLLQYDNQTIIDQCSIDFNALYICWQLFFSNQRLDYLKQNYNLNRKTIQLNSITILSD